MRGPRVVAVLAPSSDNQLAEVTRPRVTGSVPQDRQPHITPEIVEFWQGRENACTAESRRQWPLEQLQLIVSLYLAGGCLLVLRGHARVFDRNA